VNDRAAQVPGYLAPYARPSPPDLALYLQGLEEPRGKLRTMGVKCRCGASALLVGVAYNWEVVDAACPECGHEFAIYDPTLHGYNALRGRNDYWRPAFESTPFGCMCRMMTFHLAVGFGFGPNARDSDDFSFIAVAGRCTTCGVPNLVLDANCD
jgi:hypothetical protein